ncbi:RDD family protein [Paludibacterium yongneupense]|uniref:RDD family protein n=1 Tax=Paludibacterium yongneupense TaxID=400061 RepID=UPI0003FF5CA7|nr:RDD family protein [Paludibacterium yongneupense]
MNASDYVGFWPRVAAWCVDKVLFALILAALVASLKLPQGSLPDLLRQALAADAPPLFALLQEQRPLLEQALLRWLLPLIAIVGFLRWKRATPGKMLIGAEVVDAASGSAMGLAQATLRSLACTLSLLSCGLGYAWVLLDPRKQAWHDKIARTVVVRRCKR